MKFLLIGGNGFIGSHLIDVLLRNNHNVRVFDIAYERYREPIKNVDYRIASLDDLPSLYEAMLGIDIVVHLVSASVPSTSNLDAISDVNKNLISTLNILDGLIKLGIKRLVYFSSGGAVYGNTTVKTINEEHHFNPISSYGIIKATIEHYLSLYKVIYGLNTLILRPSNPYGPRQGHFIAQGVISTFLKKVQKGEPLSVFGDGHSSKDYIYIEDLVELCYNLCLTCEEGAYNLGSGNGTNLLSIIDIINKVTNKKNEVNFSEYKSYDVSNFVLDISKLKNKIGDFSLTELDKGIAKTWDWICKNEQTLINK